MELFVLPHGFRDLNPWSDGSINLGLKNGKTSWQQEYVEEEAIFFSWQSGYRLKDEEEGSGTNYD